jgi:hypothetical protein
MLILLFLIPSIPSHLLGCFSLPLTLSSHHYPHLLVVSLLLPWFFRCSPIPWSHVHNETMRGRRERELKGEEPRILPYSVIIIPLSSAALYVLHPRGSRIFFQAWYYDLNLSSLFAADVSFSSKERRNSWSSTLRNWWLKQSLDDERMSKSQAWRGDQE